MKKRDVAHPFDIALGLVWLTIIFVGLVYLLSRAPSSVSRDAAVGPAGFDQKLGTLGELRAENAPTPGEAERLRVMAELSQTEASDDRASVYVGHAAQVSMEEKLDMLQALRNAR